MATKQQNPSSFFFPSCTQFKQEALNSTCSPETVNGFWLHFYLPLWSEAKGWMCLPLSMYVHFSRTCPVTSQTPRRSRLLLLLALCATAAVLRRRTLKRGNIGAC